MSKAIKILFFLAASFAIGFFIGQYGLEYYESTTFKPWSWTAPPVVLNCYGDELDELYIVRGVDFWVSRGENVSFIEGEFIESACVEEDLAGFIILKKAKNDQLGSNILALTQRKASIMLGMVSATIYFQPGAYKLDNIMEHELGHAFGYTHIEEEGHIMHPNYNEMSGKFWLP